MLVSVGRSLLTCLPSDIVPYLKRGVSKRGEGEGKGGKEKSNMTLRFDRPLKQNKTGTSVLDRTCSCADPCPL